MHTNTGRRAAAQAAILTALTLGVFIAVPALTQEAATASSGGSTPTREHNSRSSSPHERRGSTHSLGEGHAESSRNEPAQAQTGRAAHWARLTTALAYHTSGVGEENAVASYRDAVALLTPPSVPAGAVLHVQGTQPDGSTLHLRLIKEKRAYAGGRNWMGGWDPGYQIWAHRGTPDGQLWMNSEGTGQTRGLPWTTRDGFQSHYIRTDLTNVTITRKKR